MARVRLLHPEFAAHEGLGDLPHSARLLFALLPTIADREGRLEDRPRRIKANLFPYDTDDQAPVETLLTDLEEAGFIKRYEVNGAKYIVIPGFRSWQKPHPRESESELPEPPNQQPPQGPLGEPRPAQDTPRRPVVDPVSDPDPVKEIAQGLEKTLAQAQPVEPLTAATWEAYSAAYRKRYSVEPVRNRTVNAQLAAVVKRLGAKEAPDVAGFYVQHNGAFYAQRGHAVGQFLADCEKLRTEWATGRQITGTEARQTDKTQANASGWGKHLKGDKHGLG